MNSIFEQSKVWEEIVNIPTYEVGAPNKNPMFLEKRVYQGSSGKVYPYPVIDKIYDEKKDKKYKAVFLENEYLFVMILPELGGRIQRALDKTNKYDFVYYNEVIKPALVGLTGPWISGGIEFNWPQHHRPTTFAPVDYILKQNEDGSASVISSETDQMNGTKEVTTISLYPGKAFIEIKGELFNGTSLPQTFLWWANPAVPVNDNTKSIFPPDVHAVFDHGKRDVSSFPIANGIYYKHDYSEGVDISRYKNIPVPTSYMCAHSDYDFVGGYDFGRNAGILHVCDHHVSPGKKQWTWGCGDFGKAWDRNLTDENGPYIELMTGVYTDNQPDFTWLKPFEKKSFTQYFMPYKEAGDVKNANKNIVLNLTYNENNAEICVYATSLFTNARIVLLRQDDDDKNKNIDRNTYLKNIDTEKSQLIYDKRCTISPTEIFKDTYFYSEDEENLILCVFDSDGKLLISYSPCPKSEEDAVPKPQKKALLPCEIKTNEELCLTGIHLEQYRHASYNSEDYYLEGLRRDPFDIRINTAYGIMLLRRGLYEKAEGCFGKAIAKMTEHNPNPYESEAILYLGLSLFYQEQYDKAFDAFSKAVWSAECQEMGYYYLAVISSKRDDYESALEFVRRSLVRNSENVKARMLMGKLLENHSRIDDAVKFYEENLELDPFDYNSRLSLEEVKAFEKEPLNKPYLAVSKIMGNRESSFISCASFLADSGFYEEALNVLKLCKDGSKIIKYYEAYYLYSMQSCKDELLHGEKISSEVLNILRDAQKAAAPYCFPNKLRDIKVLRFAEEFNPLDNMAPYYLGCLYYDKKRYEEAVSQWEKSIEIEDDFPTAYRNLAIVFFNKEKRFDDAKECMEKAYFLDESDARILLELAFVYKSLGMSDMELFLFLDKRKEITLSRDDLYTEYVTLLNNLGKFEEAYDLIIGHKFHPWEGGEGKVTGQYTRALIGIGKAFHRAGDYKKAQEYLMKALTFPHNLGEGKLEGQKDNDVYYYLGLCQEKLGDTVKAKEYFEKASVSSGELSVSLYYNDQPADMIYYQGLSKLALGDNNGAKACFNRLIDYGKEHMDDEVKADYFAVSLPQIQVFDEDLSKNANAHCRHLIDLGEKGLDIMDRKDDCYDI